MNMYKEMDAPCPCQNCGEWFDLHAGFRSEKWFPNTVICEGCHVLEEKEIERDEEIEDQLNALEDAVWTVNESLEELVRLGSDKKIYVSRYCHHGACENKIHEKAMDYIKSQSGKLVFNPERFLAKLNSEIAKLSEVYPKQKPISLYDFERDLHPVFYPSFGGDRLARAGSIKLEPLREPWR